MGKATIIGNVRACFKARPGYLFCSTDYSAVELCTLAQVCLWTVGESAMADLINATKDPGSLHTAFAAKMIGTTGEELQARLDAKDSLAKGYRQAAKAANFGFGGGMGAAKLVLAKRKKAEGQTIGRSGKVYPGIRFCILIGGEAECGIEKVTEWNRREIPPTCRACCEVVQHQLRPLWFEQWPEVKAYHDWVSYELENPSYGPEGSLPCFGPWCDLAEDDPARVPHRVRGGCEFSSGCNNGFQALASDGAKQALRDVTREAYTDRRSALWGTRPIMLVHDEIFAEVPEERAHAAANRLSDVMVSSMRVWVPDVHISAPPALMRFWYKDAEPVFDEAGLLIPWEPKSKAA